MLIVLTTVSKKAQAEKLAKAILAKKLAACVNILKLENSFYMWKGKLKNAKELLLIIKTSERNYRQLERFILENHVYDLPEIIALPVDSASSDYLSWVRKSC